MIYLTKNYERVIIMKLLKSNKGFSKTGILIAVGVFVLIVAISIPVAFGFIKSDHPDVNIPTSTPTEDNTPNNEVELGIIDKILPSELLDSIFSVQRHR